jgi:hypothetical protein
MTSKERFEAWMPPAMNYCEQTCAWMAWQAAEAQAVRRCAQVAGPEDTYQDEWFKAKADAVQKIKAAFPEAFK